jgi:osmotically-inducible protein OsmY
VTAGPRGVAPLIAAAALCVGCTTTPQSSPTQRAADQGLANRVSLALDNDPTYLFRHVDVSVTDGVASLSGYVWSADAIYRARHIARAVPGVNRVVTSQLELERNGRNSGVSR